MSKTTPHILLVDDDPMITQPLVRALQQQQYRVTVAADGRTGLTAALTQKPDVVVLDVMMPEMGGMDVCRELRQQSSVPILMLTAMGEEIDRVLGLELGADDYLTKPFSTRELLARIKALLRRVELERMFSEQQLEIAGVEIDFGRHTITKDGQPLEVRHKEFQLLALLMQRAGQAVPRHDIFDEVWGTDWIGDTRTLDVHIRWLREKIEPDPAKPVLIQTVRGVGYRFVER